MFLAGGGLPDLHIELIKGGQQGGGGSVFAATERRALLLGGMDLTAHRWPMV